MPPIPRLPIAVLCALAIAVGAAPDASAKRVRGQRAPETGRKGGRLKAPSLEPSRRVETKRARLDRAGLAATRTEAAARQQKLQVNLAKSRESAARSFLASTSLPRWIRSIPGQLRSRTYQSAKAASDTPFAVGEKIPFGHAESGFLGEGPRGIRGVTVIPDRRDRSRTFGETVELGGAESHGELRLGDDFLHWEIGLDGRSSAVGSISDARGTRRHFAAIELDAGLAAEIPGTPDSGWLVLEQRGSEGTMRTEIWRDSATTKQRTRTTIELDATAIDRALLRASGFRNPALIRSNRSDRGEKKPFRLGDWLSRAFKKTSKR